MRKNNFMSLLLWLCLGSFTKPVPEPVDLMIRHAKIYTIDKHFSVADAMVIRNGRIVATGTEKELLFAYTPTEITDADNRFIYPGFIDAHAHFVGYSGSLQTVNLTGTTSWEECLDRISEFLKQHKTEPGKWIVGAGWDQNDWNKKEFPDNNELNKRYPG
ncbi:MAG TPA: amidohydrolase family protein, partial [Flavitalea sp.]|nr:amidohydrolase family protein [Flavitalea sp.]